MLLLYHSISFGLKQQVLWQPKFQSPKHISCFSHIFCGINITKHLYFYGILFLNGLCKFKHSRTTPEQITHGFLLFYTNCALPWCVLINVSNSTGVFWVPSLGFSSLQGANLLLVQYYSMLSAAAVYGNYNDMYYTLVQALLKVPCLEFTVTYLPIIFLNQVCAGLWPACT